MKGEKNGPLLFKVDTASFQRSLLKLLNSEACELAHQVVPFIIPLRGETIGLAWIEEGMLHQRGALWQVLSNPIGGRGQLRFNPIGWNLRKGLK